MLLFIIAAFKPKYNYFKSVLIYAEPISRKYIIIYFKN